MRRAVAAARVGDDDEARSLLSEVTRLEPENAAAWLWLASVEAGPQRKRAAFERALALEPDNAEAAAGLERLAEKYGAAVLSEERAPAEAVHCTWHPDRETLLRCARCDKPMCPECSRQHPVGLRCKECARQTRSPLYKVSPGGYALAALGAIVSGSGAALLLAALFGLVGGIFTLLVGFVAGGLVGAPLAEVVSIAAGRKRGRGLVYTAAAGMLIGIVVAIGAAGLVRGLSINPLGYLAYLFAGIGAVRARLQ